MDDASLDEFLDAGDGDDASEDTTDEQDAGAEREHVADTDDGSDESAAVAPEGSDTAAADADAVTDEAADDAADEGSGERSVAVDPATVDAATTTYAWSADPVACADCGATGRRRWRDGDRLVCPDCKEW